MTEKPASPPRGKPTGWIPDARIEQALKKSQYAPMQMYGLQAAIDAAMLDFLCLDDGPQQRSIKRYMDFSANGKYTLDDVKKAIKKEEASDE